MDGTRLRGAAAQRRSLALLAILAVHGDAGIRRERILALLWPDGDPDRSRHALTQSLYHIRRALACDDLFTTAGADVRLNPERISSDVTRFAALAEQGDDAQALALYEGPFMDGFVLPSAADFDQWMSVQRARIQGLAGRALERLAARAENHDDWPAAISTRKRLAALDPFSATAATGLMRALWASGDRPGALQHGRAYVVLLREELDIEPDIAITRLMDELRSARDTPAKVQLAADRATQSPTVQPMAEPSAPAPKAGGPPFSRISPWRRVAMRAAVAAGVMAPIALTAIMISRSNKAASAAAPPIGAQPIVVAPFRVSGTDGSLAYLREGMVELLSSRLADDSAAHAIDPGRVLGAWRNANLTGAADTPHPEAIRIARRLGASRVIVGGIVGSQARLVLSASVLTVANGETQAQAHVEGPADSITVLVNRLAAKLVASSAGEGDRFTDRFTPSLAAFREFLDGQAAYRRGDYAAAVPAYERALARDSVFALAAMHLALAADWLNDAEQHDRALSIAWANRTDLNDRDLAHLVAFAGPRYPAPSRESEQVAAWERAVIMAPDRAEVWYELGERLFRAGGVAGVTDPHGRARSALARTLELEPGHQRARRLLVMLAARVGDTALLRRIASPAALRDSVGDISAFLRWRVALVRGDSAELRRIRNAMPQLNDQSLRAMAMSSLNDAVGLDDGERAARITFRRANRVSAWFDALMEQHSIALNEGRPAVALSLTEQIPERQPGSHAHLRLRILDALYSDGDRAAAAAAAEALRPIADAPLERNPDARGVQLADMCVLEQWRLHDGVTSTTRRAIARLRTSTLPRRSIPVSANQFACADILDALLAVETRQNDAVSRVAKLDSLMLSGPAASDATSYAHIVVGRLYQELGNPRAALTAFRRRSYMNGWPRYLSTVRREEAELATTLGETAIARASFARYMALRRAPEATIALVLDTVTAATKRPRLPPKHRRADR